GAAAQESVSGWSAAAQDRTAAAARAPTSGGTQQPTGGVAQPPAGSSASQPATGLTPSRVPASPASQAPAHPASQAPAKPASPATPPPQPAPDPAPVHAATADSRALQSRGPADDIVATITHLVRDYFTSGNTLVRVGIIILFFGVAFLLRYVAEHSHVPIEFRL